MEWTSNLCFGLTPVQPALLDPPKANQHVLIQHVNLGVHDMQHFWSNPVLIVSIRSQSKKMDTIGRIIRP